jgi:hypothetical protein
LREDDIFEPDWALLALDAIARRTPTPVCRIGLRVPHRDRPAGFVVQGGPEGTRIAKGEPSGGALIEARFDVVLQILARQVPLDAAIANRQARTEGSKRVLRKFPDLFDLATARI